MFHMYVSMVKTWHMLNGHPFHIGNPSTSCINPLKMDEPALTIHIQELGSSWTMKYQAQYLVAQAKQPRVGRGSPAAVMLKFIKVVNYMV